jgi:hypothetical protein
VYANIGKMGLIWVKRGDRNSVTAYSNMPEWFQAMRHCLNIAAPRARK